MEATRTIKIHSLRIPDWITAGLNSNEVRLHPGDVSEDEITEILGDFCKKFREKYSPISIVKNAGAK